MNQQTPVGSGGPPLFPAPQNNLQSNVHSVATQHPLPPPPFPNGGPAGAALPPPIIAPLPAAKPRPPFTATRADAWLAVACLVLGFLFMRWLTSWQGWGVTLFTLAYVAVLLVYAWARGIRPAAASWFWLGVLLLAGGSFALWPGGTVSSLRDMLLFGSAVYWCGGLLGGWMENKTTNHFFFDMINLLFMVPFRNFSLAFRGLAAFKNGKDGKNKENQAKKRWQLLYILLGVALALLVLVVVVPLLMRADSGGFGRLLGWLQDLLSLIYIPALAQAGMQLVWGIPVALYLCGLVAGLAHRRYAHGFQRRSIARGMAALRVVPTATVATVLALVCALYVVFIACQLPYFFSAFAGVRPQGYEVYSYYAREGFFELCRIAVINLGLMALGCALSRTKRQENLLIRILCIILSALTLLLIATAFSKMALYIGAYGLTINRLLPCVFLVFLALVCGAVIALQFKAFSVVRFSVACGAVLVCLLCLSNPDGLVVRYNAERYLNGTLPTFDTDQVAAPVYRGGAMAAQAALDVMENTPDPALRKDLAERLHSNRQAAQNWRATHTDCLDYVKIRAIALPEETDIRAPISPA